jgi:glyoxylate/hydroxypyruvate reductase A
MNVLLCGRLDGVEYSTWLAALCAAMPEATWLDEARARAVPGTVVAAVVANPAPGSLSGWPALRLIQSLWAGVEGLLGDRSLPADVPIARMVDPSMNRAMAETALWATLSLQRRFHDYALQQRRSQWQQLPQRRADECRVLVLGQGEMGRGAAATLARQGFPVTGWSRTPSAVAGDGVRRLDGDAALPSALADADVLINLLPLTTHTRGLLDARLFSAMPPGAAVVNLARGAHLVEADLLAALDSGHLRHAVLDVFGEEPLPAGHAFWSHDQVTVLPHAAALTDPRTAAEVVAKNLRALRDGAPLLHRVDRQRGY